MKKSSRDTLGMKKSSRDTLGDVGEQRMTTLGSWMA
jgi:hypothetical protein